MIEVVRSLTAQDGDVHTCRLHGLNVTSPFLLGHPATRVGRSDIQITVDHARTAQDHMSAVRGRRVAAHSPGWPDYQLIDHGADGYFYRIRDYVDIDISPDQSALHCRLADAASEGLLPVMLAGHVLATLLLLRGESVFHASAVEMDGAGIAFVGNSGAGKSTLAAVVCRRGATLVTDDVLRVEQTGSSVSCYRGAAALRLRPGSKALAGTADEDVSSDGRLLHTPEPTPFDRLPLEKVFIPRLRDPDHPLVCTALDARSALFALLQFPRVQNWTDPHTSALHFDKLVMLVQLVPVFFIDLPWGVPTGEAWFDRFADLIFGNTDHYAPRS